MLMTTFFQIICTGEYIPSLNDLGRRFLFWPDVIANPAAFLINICLMIPIGIQRNKNMDRNKSQKFPTGFKPKKMAPKNLESILLNLFVIFNLSLASIAVDKCNK